MFWQKQTLAWSLSLHYTETLRAPGPMSAGGSIGTENQTLLASQPAHVVEGLIPWTTAQELILDH